jgi:hypothetical protein
LYHPQVFVTLSAWFERATPKVRYELISKGMTSISGEADEHLRKG